MTARGMAYYAAMHPRWPAKESLAVFSGKPVACMSVLWRTFGTSTKTLERFFNLPQKKILQVHLLNEVGLRNNRLGSYEVLFGYTPATYQAALLKRDARLFKNLTKYFLNVKNTLDKMSVLSATDFLISPGLESNLNMKAARVLVDLTKEIFAGQRIVWNPAGINVMGGDALSGTVFEVHGSSVHLSAPCIYNLDGEDIDLSIRKSILQNKISEARLPEYFRKASASGAEACFIWLSEFNLVRPGRFVDPRQRDNFPSGKLLSYVSRYL